MSTSTVSLETDADGFVSQECPSCMRRFKVKFGEGSDRPIGSCPYCSHAGRDCWWTQAQADYFAAVAGQEVVGPMLDKFARNINRGNRSGSVLNIKASVNHGPRPIRPSEPNDSMPSMTFACCNERIKHDGASARLHCIICGASADTAHSAPK